MPTTTASVLNLPDDVRMLDVVRTGIDRADDVRVAVSFTRCSGLGLLVDNLKDLGRRGGQARILTSTYMNVTQPDALRTLRRFDHVDTRIQSGDTGFHAKFWSFHGGRGTECWAGSSNLSKAGLDTSLEWNVRLLDGDLVDRAKGQFEVLWQRPDVQPLSDEFLDQYDRHWRATSSAPPASAFKGKQPSSSPHPNPAQWEALEQLGQLRERGQRRAAVIAATGIGKTHLAAFDVLHMQAKSLLYVSHRLEHLLQARRTFASIHGEAVCGIVGGGHDQSTRPFLFATVQSVTQRPDLLARRFEYLVIDEFHHADARSYQALRPILASAFLLGLTATPERQDGHDVLEWCDWNVAYELRLPEAIDRSWLLPFHYFGIADETIDYFHLESLRQLDDIEAALSVSARADLVLKHALERGFDGPKRAAVGFCAGIRHARFMADAFRERGQQAVAVWGEMSVEDREAVYGRLGDPRDPLEWVFVADVLNEGVDIPAINTVLFLRPTESATIFLQQLGRGLRLHPGTEVLTVLDFVGHHRSSWLALQALQAPGGGGRRTEIVPGIPPILLPRGCEIVLERRTREILAKIERFTTRREACDDAYRRLREDLGRALLPVDLWAREDVPTPGQFRATHGSWAACVKAHGDTPAWQAELPDDHVALQFLKVVESDWQAQRVTPYALVWGLAAHPGEPELGYEEFFQRWPQWAAEHTPLQGAKTWDTVRRKLEHIGALEGDRLHPDVVRALGDQLLPQVEGRLLYTVNKDHRERHGGVLRTPEDLHVFARYLRPEAVRHFGAHYDPAKHNTGMLWLPCAGTTHGVIVTKLDTSTAVAKHQYQNQFIDASTFSWTSQNKQGVDNEAGRKVVEHQKRGLVLHLFVQPRSHEPAFYLGPVTCAGAAGTGPMVATFRLSRPVPGDVWAELLGRDEVADAAPS